MKAIVKINWGSGEPVLKLATPDGYEYVDLDETSSLNYEISDERRCTGYHAEKGRMEPCPEFREIDSGDQCSKCRGKDVYTGWRQGNSAPEHEDKYSVYIAQCGTEVKVGVASSRRLRTRWLEQGAIYAAEVFSGLTGEEALEKEREISSKGIKERISKTQKTGFDTEKVRTILEKLDLEAEVEKISQPLKCRKIVRDGRLPNPITEVSGQIVSNSKLGIALTSGKTLVEPKQTGLTDF